jgi:hypothetical protein
LIPKSSAIHSSVISNRAKKRKQDTQRQSDEAASQKQPPQKITNQSPGCKGLLSHWLKRCDATLLPVLINKNYLLSAKMVNTTVGGNYFLILS